MVICYSKDNATATPQKFAECSNLLDAAKRCNSYCSNERNGECINAILERGYYLRGYGPSMVYIEIKD